MKNKLRLDKYLAENKYSKSREQARREIISGWVKINQETVHNPAHNITGNEKIEIKRPGGLYVSRGGGKLAFALKNFKIDVLDKIIADLGASTGGFTDCLLKNGAKKVYAIDVGYGQLDFLLRNDKRVIVKERTNARKLSLNLFNDNIDFITADLSFVSFLKVYKDIKNLFPDCEGIVLIKPQFEADSNEHKKGVVTKKECHIDILSRIFFSLADMGMKIKDVTYSPLKGPKGNIEFLVYFSINNEPIESKNLTIIVNEVVEKAHQALNK